MLIDTLLEYTPYSHYIVPISKDNPCTQYSRKSMLQTHVGSVVKTRTGAYQPLGADQCPQPDDIEPTTLMQGFQYSTSI